MLYLAGSPPFFLGRRENRGSESEAPTLRGYPYPLVFCVDKPLPCCCFPLSALLLFQAQSLTEAIGLSNEFKDVCFMRQPIKKRIGHDFILEYIIMPLSLIVLLAEATLGGMRYLLLSSIPSRASLWLAGSR